MATKLAQLETMLDQATTMLQHMDKPGNFDDLIEEIDNDYIKAIIHYGCLYLMYCNCKQRNSDEISTIPEP